MFVPFNGQQSHPQTPIPVIKWYFQQSKLEILNKVGPCVGDDI